MNSNYTIEQQPVKQYRIILSILLFELIIYFFCNIHVSAFVKNTFIGFEQDPLLWLIYYTGLPQFVLSNIFLSCFVDISILFFIGAIIFKPLNKWIAIGLFILLFVATSCCFFF